MVISGNPKFLVDVCKSWIKDTYLTMLAPTCIGANDSVKMVAIAKNLFSMVADAGWSTGGSPCIHSNEGARSLLACLI